MYTKVCAYFRCKNIFETEIQNKRFCSEECIRRNRNERTYAKNRADLTAARKEAKLAIGERPKRCVFPNCTVDTGLDIDHIDGNPLNREDSNLRYLCVYHHGLLNNPSSYNKYQLDTFGSIRAIPLFCRTADRMVICTNIKCSGRKHCSGIKVEKKE